MKVSISTLYCYPLVISFYLSLFFLIIFSPVVLPEFSRAFYFTAFSKVILNCTEFFKHKILYWGETSDGSSRNYYLKHCENLKC